jgi:hypothetical protein
MDKWNGKYTRPIDLLRADPLEFAEWMREQMNDPAQQEYRRRMAEAFDPKFQVTPQANSAA